MILVTGATGEFGKAAINFLLKKGVNPSEISALVRSKEKATDLKEKGITIKVSDYNDYDGLVNAFTGVGKLLFVSGSEIETREVQHKNIVDAAKEAGVKYIAYTSFIRNTPVENSSIAFLQDTHVKTENWIKESGIPYTILQNALYMDMIPIFAGEAVLNNALILQPADQGKSSSVLREELAEVAANVIIGEGHENKVYPLSNPEAHTYQNVAEIITEASGKEIKYQSPSAEEFQTTLTALGVPAEYIGLFTAFSVAQAKGELELNDSTLEKLLGRKPITAKVYLTKIYS